MGKIPFQRSTVRQKRIKLKGPIKSLKFRLVLKSMLLKCLASYRNYRLWSIDLNWRYNQCKRLILSKLISMHSSNRTDQSHPQLNGCSKASCMITNLIDRAGIHIPNISCCCIGYRNRGKRAIYYERKRAPLRMKTLWLCLSKRSWMPW